MKQTWYAAALIFLFCAFISLADSYPAPKSTKVYSVTEISRSLFDLDDQVVRIQYTPRKFRQVSEDWYEDTLVNADTRAVIDIRFPAQKFRSLFMKNKKKSMSVYVHIKGGVLTAIGTSISRDIRGKVSYR